jgi:membrane-associated phospholipid phosphatase
MLEHLIQLDQNLFFIINNGLANPFFDWLMPLLRNRFLWSPLYLFLIIFFVRNYGKQGWMLLLFFILSFGVTDFFTASVIKPTVERLRPCNNPELKTEIRSLVACGSGYSFPSAHAANHFALAVFLITLFYHKWKPILTLALLWAASISFAQVYVGVHFPLDITVGAFIGSNIGYLMGRILLLTQPFRKWKTGN